MDEAMSFIFWLISVLKEWQTLVIGFIGFGFIGLQIGYSGHLQRNEFIHQSEQSRIQTEERRKTELRRMLTFVRNESAAIRKKLEADVGKLVGASRVKQKRPVIVRTHYPTPLFDSIVADLLVLGHGKAIAAVMDGYLAIKSLDIEVVERFGSEGAHDGYYVVPADDPQNPEHFGTWADFLMNYVDRFGYVLEGGLDFVEH